MPAKKPIRFPLVFDDAPTRKGAQRRADEDYRGNLTAYINFLIRQDLRRRTNSKKK